MVAHLDDLRGMDDIESVGIAALGRQHLADARAVAEEHDTAPLLQSVERHDGTLDRCLGGEVAAHGIKTYLYHKPGVYF